MFDPFGFGANYLGRSVTLTGANGYSVTGRAILDYGGTYPSVFTSRTLRRALFADTTYHAGRDLDISGGGRIEREEGFSNPDADPTATRNNGGVFAEARGTVAMRTYVTAGIGVEHNHAAVAVSIGDEHLAGLRVHERVRRAIERIRVRVALADPFREEFLHEIPFEIVLQQEVV